jgi:hypothetical protein
MQDMAVAGTCIAWCDSLEIPRKKPAVVERNAGTKVQEPAATKRPVALER